MEELVKEYFKTKAELREMLIRQHSRETEIKEMIINNRDYELLSINWNRLKRMVR